ncbi:hypothetical protein ELY15_11775 [Legionella sp. km772]|nr:hypothetical protein ELY15_11775 [Legionella sp. km772]
MKSYKDVNYSLALGLLVASSALNAGTMGAVGPAPGSFYIGAFGGAGGVGSENLSQHGIAYFAPPLDVNAYGKASDSDTVGVGGGFIGYKFGSLSGTPWAMTPALEFEGYYFGLTQRGHDIDDNTNRLLEHDFSVSYPMDNGVLLANGVLNFDTVWGSVRPYIGGGIGAAIISISGADSLQTTPLELGVNHYNSNTSDDDWSFAAQVKAGLNFSVSQQVSLFAEYRFLYVSPTDFTFGSTQYPGHVPTTNWNVHLDSMYYNMGTVGLRYDV